MKLKMALPSGLTNKIVERFDPSQMGGIPSIHYVPVLSTKATKADRMDMDDIQQVKITISSEVSLAHHN